MLVPGTVGAPDAKYEEELVSGEQKATLQPTINTKKLAAELQLSRGDSSEWGDALPEPKFAEGDVVIAYALLPGYTSEPMIITAALYNPYADPVPIATWLYQLDDGHWYQEGYLTLYLPPIVHKVKLKNRDQEASIPAPKFKKDDVVTACDHYAPGRITIINPMTVIKPMTVTIARYNHKSTSATSIDPDPVPFATWRYFLNGVYWYNEDDLTLYVSPTPETGNRRTFEAGDPNAIASSQPDRQEVLVDRGAGGKTKVLNPPPVKPGALPVRQVSVTAAIENTWVPFDSVYEPPVGVTVVTDRNEIFVRKDVMHRSLGDWFPAFSISTSKPFTWKQIRERCSGFITVVIPKRRVGRGQWTESQVRRNERYVVRNILRNAGHFPVTALEPCPCGSLYHESHYLISPADIKACEYSPVVKVCAECCMDKPTKRSKKCLALHAHNVDNEYCAALNAIRAMPEPASIRDVVTIDDLAVATIEIPALGEAYDRF
jgi:hypothetical protein